MRNAASCRSRGNRDAGPGAPAHFRGAGRNGHGAAVSHGRRLRPARLCFGRRAAARFPWSWAPGKGEFGILPMAVGSLAVGFSAVIPGWLMGLCLCCWLLCPSARRSPRLLARRGGRPCAHHDGRAHRGVRLCRGVSAGSGHRRGFGGSGSRGLRRRSC